MAKKYQWTQVEIPSSTSTGVQPPEVVLQAANTATPTFVAPVLPYDTTIAFSLRVTDSDGGAVSSNSAIVYIMVKHNPNLNLNNNSPTNSGGNNLNPNMIQPQLRAQQPHQPTILNNNAISPPPPLLSNSAPSSSSSIPQTGLPIIHNPVVP